MVSRRKLLQSGIVVSAAGLAGCPDGGTDAGSNNTDRATTSTPGTGTESGTETATQAAKSGQFSSFVERDGSELVVDGEPTYFNGAANLALTQPAETSREQVDAQLQAMAEMDINVLRTAAFGSGTEDSLQPEPGTFNEAAFEHLDYVVAKAAEHGIRLILPLTSYHDDFGGIPQYVEWVGAENEADFYLNDEAQRLYRDFVGKLLKRENTVSGVTYRNDPAIAIWELADRPRVNVADTDKNNIGIMQGWIQANATFIKDNDGNHLLSTGIEGQEWAGSQLWQEKSLYGWNKGLRDGRHGVSYVRNHDPDVIDVTSFHLYPEQWDLSDEESAMWIEKHLREAEVLLGKPVYCAGFNWPADSDSEIADRDRKLRRWYNQFDRHDANAVTIANLVGEGAEDPGEYAITPDDESTRRIISSYSKIASRKPIPAGERNEPPTPKIEISSASIETGEEVTLSASGSSDSDGEIIGYNWAISNGESGTGEELTVSFEETGQYDIELMVTDGGGEFATTTRSITVSGGGSGTVYTVKGSGTDVYGETNDCVFVHKTLSGDGSIEARVASVEETHGWAKGGVMIRDSLEEDSPMAATGQTPLNGQQYLWSSDYGRPTEGNNPVREPEQPPAYARIERSGSTVTGYTSIDGEEWTETGSEEIALGEDVYVGLFVMSHVQGTINTSVFDSVSDLGDDYEVAEIGDASGSVEAE
jgi:mannan endo-1,4-beta-mannosidase